MKTALRSITVLFAALMMCFKMQAFAQDMAVLNIGCNGQICEAVDFNAETIEFYLSGDFKKSRLTKDNVTITDSLGNTLLLNHISYDYDLSALCVLPKEILGQNEKYTLKIDKTVFGGSEDLTYLFTTDYEAVTVKAVSIEPQNGACLTKVSFDCKNQKEAKVFIVCTLLRGGKLENVSVNAADVNETTILNQPFTAQIDGVLPGDTVNSCIWYNDGEMLRLLSSAVYEYSEETP